MKCERGRDKEDGGHGNLLDVTRASMFLSHRRLTTDDNLPRLESTTSLTFITFDITLRPWQTPQGVNTWFPTDGP